MGEFDFSYGDCDNFILSEQNKRIFMSEWDQSSINLIVFYSDIKTYKSFFLPLSAFCAQFGTHFPIL